MNPTPNALPALAVSNQSGQPFPSYCWILDFLGSHLNSARRLPAGCAPGVVWQIDSAHQRYTEASIKKRGPSLLCGGRGWELEQFSHRIKCVNARWSVMSYRATVLNSTLWGTDGVSVDEFLPNAWQSMWNGDSSAHKDKSTGAPGKLKMTCDVSNELTAARSHRTKDLVDHVGFDCENPVSHRLGNFSFASPQGKKGFDPLWMFPSTAPFSHYQEAFWASD